MIYPNKSVLLTDLYQLTMLQAYHRLGMQQTAVFEFFVRRLPAGRTTQHSGARCAAAGRGSLAPVKLWSEWP